MSSPAGPGQSPGVGPDGEIPGISENSAFNFGLVLLKQHVFFTFATTSICGS